jgi:acetyl-CoA carboxylase biotin carboxylase subunit
MFRKILVANRGEIAVRVLRTCKEMGITTAVVYSDADINSLHVKLADEAYYIGPPEAMASYLNMDKLLEIAIRSKSEAIHPGYGFLAENPEFTEMCEKHGIVFIGPPSQSMLKVKPKNKARQLMRLLNIPIVPGADEAFSDFTGEQYGKIEKIADEIGYPIIIKPAGGGGGIGMVVADRKEDLRNALTLAQESGRKAFGMPSFYVEKLLTGVKHIEVQVLADKFGNVIHLGDRDCSVQRRHQKLIEEAPCSILTPHLRMKMYVAAMDVAVALQYVNALTVEFFYNPTTQEFYFNEVNTRLQVEHCVTELATNFDIVKEQIRIANGEVLSCTQDQVGINAHAIECRIQAEDVAKNFLPTPGMITELRFPHGIGVRIDEGVQENGEVPIYYDSLLFKLMVRGKDRDEAVLRMKRALDEIIIGGVQSTVLFHQVAMEDETFKSGRYTTDFVAERDIVQKVRERMRILSSPEQMYFG